MSTCWDEDEFSHDWELTGAWGVIIGHSRCKRCGRLATIREDFPALKEENDV